MADVVVKGTLQEILDKMYRIQGIIISRKMAGWTPFQDDEHWEYHGQTDDRLCPVCENFHDHMDFDGDEMQSNFPDLVQWNGPGYMLVRPRVHVTYPDLVWSKSPDAEGGCRCRVLWIDAEDTLADRMAQEFREVV